MARQDCPTSIELTALAAGQTTPKEAELLLGHASECETCSEALTIAAAALTEAEEVTAEEEAIIGQLSSSQPAWREETARRMSRQRRMNVRWFPPIAAILVAGASIGGVYYWFLDPAKRVGSNLIRAYTEQRPFEFRLPDAGYAELRLQKEGVPSALAKPEALLDAEAALARRMRDKPGDAQWLELQGQAELLSRNHEGAIAALSRAVESAPQKPEVLALLGVAYALRAEVEDRTSDYGRALEYLTQAVKLNPASGVAVFNRAIVLEKLRLYSEAESQWKQFLELDSTSGWAVEARQRLEALVKRKKARREALDRIRGGPELFLTDAASGRAHDPELYQELALADWLRSARTSEKAREALRLLAANLEDRHRDTWLRELLETAPCVPEGIARLTDAMKANVAGSPEQAYAHASAARDVFARTGCRVGELRAGYELLYAGQRTLGLMACREDGDRLERELQPLGYTWLRIAVLLDLANCVGVDGDEDLSARRLARAQGLVGESGYRVLELRALGLRVNLPTSAGNPTPAWTEGFDGLARYWEGVNPGMRANQFYWDLSRASEYLGMSQTALAFGRAAVGEIAGGGNRLAELSGRLHLSSLAIAAEDARQAEEQVDSARVIGDSLEKNETVRRWQVSAALARADALIRSRRVDDAESSLDALPANLIYADSLKRHLLFGSVYWSRGDYEGARHSFEAAITLGERRLSEQSTAANRSAAARELGTAYRGMVDLVSRNEGTRALLMWAAYRQREYGDPEPPGTGPRGGNTWIVYAKLPSGYTAWIADNAGVAAARLQVAPEVLDGDAQRFARLCADGASDASKLRREARRLYDMLIGPFAARVRAASELTISPDGELVKVPFAVLEDHEARTLGESASLSVSSRVFAGASLARDRVTADSELVLVASPALGPKASRVFPPLAEAAREAETVAGLFRRVTIVSGRQANVAAIKQVRPKAEVFHFSGHGFSNAGYGGLVLAPAREGDDATVLTARQVDSQDWTRCRLAVLSACLTAAGETRGAGSPESLVRAFITAGVKRVVASRWPVDARSTTRLMEKFYRHLLSGAPPGEALGRAAGEIRSDPATSHPYYWAGFDVFG